MNKFMIKSLVVAVATTFAASAYAAVDVNLGTGAVKFASELTYSSATPLVGAAGQMSVTGKLGFGVSANATKFIRLTLANGTFKTAAGALSVACATTVAGTIVQGGGVGDNYVIYQFTAPTGDCTQAAIWTVGDSAAGYIVASNASPVTVRYNLHDTAVDAVNQTNSLFAAGPVSLITFGPALNYALTPNTSTAEVTSGFKNFTAASPSTTLAKIGGITYGVTGAFKHNGTAAALVDLLSAATFTIAADLSATATVATDLFLDNQNNCASSFAPFVINAGKTSATYSPNSTALTAGTNLCWKVTGTTVLNAQVFTSALTVTAQAGSTVAGVAAATVGTIVRNGASTIALNLPDQTNTDQGFVRISNMGTGTGKITGTLFAQDGTQLGAADVTLVASAAAKSTTVFSSADLATAFGVTGWAGRAKLVIIGEFPAGQLRVQNLVRASNGTLVNVGGDTSGNGN